MSEVTYRLATEADLTIVAGFYEKLDALLHQLTYSFPAVENVGQLWVDTFRRSMGRFTAVYIAEYEGRPVGFILARLKRVAPYLGGVMVGELSDMWVEHEVRRMGVGEMLLRLAIEWLRLQNVYSVEAQILSGNEPILKLVRSLGMKDELHQMRLTWEDYDQAIPGNETQSGERAGQPPEQDA